MKNKYFSNALKNYINENKISREHIIDSFNNSSFIELAKCDLTTLSRWVSGKTEPNLYKQFMVCICLGIDLFEYIKGIEPCSYTEGKKNKSFIDNYMRYLNNSNANIGHFERCDAVSVYYSKLNKNKHRDLLDPYFKNFSGFISLRHKVDAAKVEKDFHTFLFKENNNICGHLSFTDDSEDLLKVFGVYRDELKHSIGITPAYYLDSKVYWMIASSLLYFYLDQGNYKKNIYATMSTRDRNSWEFYKQIGDAETLAFFSPTENSHSSDKGLFFIKFNLLKLLSQPTILSKFQCYINSGIANSYTKIDANV